ncbi:folate-binding protein YgfZ [Azoarcus sp. DN11]|uniref:CAF17-like 4Fe-4S cluster assembly/insertion protein YgfZ n=1 Tax=Azoarcus sp. DN11 TaxID=356837 RepID=UPI000EB42FCC|nr:folate-binding protein YgfZ [Azoarcus sp. DN11]AYH44758.1 folate-binding protein YgfZ [Azoarcus sp. DN11]
MNTLWTEFLVREGATLEGSGIRFNAPETEVRAVESGTVVVPLVHLGLIRCAGDDSVSFLHNLLSNDVKKLGPQAAQWSSFNTPKGRMLASLLLWNDGTGQMIATSADVQQMLQKKLSMYVLRSKVKLADATPDIALIGVSGAAADALLAGTGIAAPLAPMTQSVSGELRCIRLDQRNLVLAVPAAAAPEVFAKLAAGGAAKAGTAAWQLAMIRAGLPLITAATQEEFVAQMLNFEVIGGVSFNKGCYPGQEIVARTQYLGKLKKRMYHVHVPADAAPVAGADLFTPEFGEQSAGKLVNVAAAPEGGFEALAVMQISCAEAGEVHLGSPRGPQLQFLDLPYALPEK